LVVCAVGPLTTTATTASPTPTTTSELMTYSADYTSSTHPGQGNAIVPCTNTNLYKHLSSNYDARSWKLCVCVCVCG